MPPTRTLAFLLAAAAANHCRAQEFVSYSWSFVEVVAGTNTPVAFPNGILDLSEGVRLSLNVTVSPAVGSTVTYTPPPPPGIGTVAGLSSIFFDLLSTGAAQGTWSFIRRDAAWALGDPGTPTASGVVNIQAGQFHLPPQVANSQNPIPAIWTGVWTPTSYLPRSVLFYSASSLEGGSRILIQYGTQPGTGAPLYLDKYVSSQHGQVLIPVVPAPSTAALMLLLIAHRRRHRAPRTARPDPRCNPT